MKAKLFSLAAVANFFNQPIMSAKRNLNQCMICRQTFSSYKSKHYCVVPVASIVRPLLVYEDYGGDRSSYYSALPKREWARYFGDEIRLDGNEE